MNKALANGLLFNLSWFLIVYTQSNAWAPVIAALHVCGHMLWMGQGRRELLFVLLLTACGLLLDQVLFFTGVFTIEGAVALAPFWLGCLWPVLGTTALHVFAPLRSKLLLAAIFGGVGGYLSYSLGMRMTIVDFGASDLAPLVIAALWSVLFPLLLIASERIAGSREGAVGA